jgi:methyl coenzyme M reductase subunit C-like uncharacterized protein (methanogenesis marker protein 7)
MKRFFSLLLALGFSGCTPGDDVSLFNATSAPIVVTYEPTEAPARTIKPGSSGRVSYHSAQQGGITGLRI